jgi:hypothetical protein
MFGGKKSAGAATKRSGDRDLMNKEIITAAL